MLNPEIEALLRAIDDDIYQVKQIREAGILPQTRRIEHIESLIRDKRRRIEEIENETI